MKETTQLTNEIEVALERSKRIENLLLELLDKIEKLNIQ